MHMLLALALALLATTTPEPPPAQGNNIATHTTMLKPVASPGEAISPAMQEAMEALNSRDYVTASTTLQPILDACKAKDQASKGTLVSFANAGEFIAYSTLAMRQSGTAGDQHKDIAWVHDDCALAYKSAAFLYVDANDMKDALLYLDLASRRAPYWAEVCTERGFALMRTGDPQGALAAYDKAIELADQFQSSAYVKPVALRGLGFVYTETGKLDQARQAYEESLRIEPGNELAKNELRYIAGLRKNRQTADGNQKR